MFPITHLYLLSGIAPLENYSVLGSLFPDTCIAGFLSWDDTHLKGLDLISSLSQDEKDILRPFLTGLLAHSVNPQGLDYYSDESMSTGDSGYSFIKAKSIAGEVQRVCHLPEELGLWKAHNIIEMAVEVKIAAMMPSLSIDLSRAFKAVDSLTVISDIISPFYKIPPLQVALSYNILRDYIPAEPPDSVNLGKCFAKQLEHKHSIKGVSSKDVSELICLAEPLIAEDFMGFLDSCKKSILDSMPVWLGDSQKK